MAPSFSYSRPRAELAQNGISASASETTSAAPSPSKVAPAGVTLPPHGVAALIGIIIMLTTVVLGFVGWRLWVWKKQKKSGEHPTLFSPVSDVHRSPMLQSSKNLNVNLPADVGSAMIRDRSPSDFKVNLNYQPKVVYSAPQEPTATKPLPAISVTPSGLQISPPPLYAEIPPTAPSPRTASKVPSPTPSVKTLPRLVIVVGTFTTTLHDELEIREGEVLRLLEEYADEWCLVQRVGPVDAEKGVVPQFCIVDKPVNAQAKKSKHITRLPSVSET